MKISDLKTYKVIGNTLPTETPPEPKKTFGGKLNNAAKGIVNFVGAGPIADTFGTAIARNFDEKGNFVKKSQEEKNTIPYPSQKAVIGSAIQTGANLLPGAGKGLGLLAKVGVGAGTGYAMDVGSKLQNKETSVGQSLTPGIGTVAGATLPVAGATVGYANRVMGRLFKGLGSGISGVSTKTLDDMLNNPKVAQQASNKLAISGNNKILEQNAKTIVNGVSKIQSEARKAYGQGLEQLAKTDINPVTFKQATQQVLDKYGSTASNGKRVLTNVEFTDPKNIKKASELINQVSKANFDLNGKSLRKLADDIESSAYKIATSDERLSFNAFIKDLSASLKNAISGSTDKLGEIDQKFSQDMQLSQAVQNIFGKVNFKNVSEVAKAAKSLESLFNQKGLDPQTTENFLTRIGVNPQDFKTTEAVRQITNKEPMPSNTPGFNMGEIMRTATGSLLTPETIKNITIKTGLAKESLKPFLTGLQSLSPGLQKAVIQALLQTPQ